MLGTGATPEVRDMGATPEMRDMGETGRKEVEAITATTTAEAVTMEEVAAIMAGAVTTGVAIIMVAAAIMAEINHTEVATMEEIREVCNQ